MPDDAERTKSIEAEPADRLVDRLQVIDEQLAGELPTRIATEACEPDSDPTQEHQIERVKNVFQLINRLRRRESETGFDPAVDVPTARPPNRTHPEVRVDRDLTSDREPTAGFPPTGFRIGTYVVEEEIARGGMGIVFRARDLKLNRVVALKILRAGPLAREEDRIRFRGEAEAAAQLDHPGIVPVYEVGNQDGVHYFTMGIVYGSSLSELIRQSPVEPGRAATIAKQIAEAADYAHQRGVVHRDIKPSNVLFDSFERVRVADFGLARRIDDGSELTETGQVVGTPEYMAPEQAAGNASTAGPSADIYSIGATLYCMLTGQPPFRSSSSIETLR